jgi:Na+/proline symporter
VVYPELPRMGLPNPSEGAYAVASLTLLPHGLIGVMLASMFSATMANLSAQFNVKSAILTKDIYQSLFRKSAGERELLVVGWITTFLIGGATTVIAVIMAASGQSVFQIMLTFNTLMSLAYGPPALLGLVVRRTPPWSGLASFATGLILGMLGAFLYHWSLIQQVAIIIPASFGIFFLTMFFDRGDTPGRALLFRNLNTPVNVAKELKDSPDFTVPVFRFLSRTISSIGLLSLVLLFTVPPHQRITVIWFAALTVAVGGLLWFVRGAGIPERLTNNSTRSPLPARFE